MGIEENRISGFFDASACAAKTILEVVEEDGFIHVFSHLDADGVAAAGIIGKMLFRLGAKFRVRVTQWVDEKIVSEILADRPQLVIFTDFGSGYIDLLNQKLANFKIIVLDHHQVTQRESSIVHVNPHLNGIDGARDISGAGVAYFVAKAVDKNHVDLAPIAIVGALGDLQDKYDQKKLGGLNEKIVGDALKNELIAVEKDIIFFGRETRPIHKSLAATTNPFIPDISGREDKSVEFLTSLNIKLKDGEKWRTLRDLSEEEKKTLCSAIADHLLSKGLHYEIRNLVGYIYTLKNEEPWTPLRDAREFAVLLNAVGRMDKPSLGVSICMGDRSSAFENAIKVLEKYRETISKYLGWIMEKPSERVKELNNIYVVYGEDFINDKIIGAVSSILSTNLSKPEKPLIAYSNVKNENLAKFSARTVDIMVNRGVNLGEIMHVAAEKCMGNGGGHNIAAGAQVPMDRADDFVKIVDDFVGRQLRGEKIGG